MDMSILWIFLLSIWKGIEANTIKTLIDTDPRLTTLRAYAKNLNSKVYIDFFGPANADKFYLFLAPSNEAFAKLPREERDQFDQSTQKARDNFNQLMRSHTVLQFEAGGGIKPDTKAVRSADFGPIAKPLTNLEGTSIFYLKNGNTYYLNGARVLEADKVMSNGVVHIVDDVMYPFGEKANLFEYIENPRNRYSEFLKLLNSYDESKYLAKDTLIFGEATVFAPTNKAFARIPDSTLALLRNNRLELKKVVDSHVIKQNVYHKNVLLDLIPGSVLALEGQVTPKLFGPQLYVKNNCVQGRILNDSVESVTLDNGVLHPVDTVLGFRHNSLLNEIEARRDLYRFYGHISSSETVKNDLNWAGLQGSEVPAEKRFTVFAPNNEGMSDVDLTQQDLDNILKFHMVSGEHSLSDLATNQKMTLGVDPITKAFVPAKVTMETDPNTGLLTTYVEVNHVLARVVVGDICVKNGLLHVIDNVVGVPTDKTVDFMANHEHLSDLYKAINELSMDADFDFKQLTIFAPTDAAFQKMRQTQIGRDLLSSKYESQLRRVLQRHMVNGEGIILTNTNVPQNLRSQFDDIAVKRTGDTFFVTFNANEDVKIIRPNIRTVNAVIHLIDEVMYIDDLMAAELTGVATTVSMTTAVMVTSLLATCLLS